MKILSFNVNGLRAILKKGFLDFVHTENPDILCLQETKVSYDQLPFDLKIIDSYEAFFHSASKKGYSGVATYTKIKPEKIIDKIGIAKFDQEGRILHTQFADFDLLNVYFPNGKMSKERLDFKMEFYGKFLQYILDLRQKGRKIIFCGDVNTAHKEIDLARPKENEDISGFLPQERAWIDQLIKNDFIDIFRKFNREVNQYTWWSQRARARERNIGWRIDYFFVDKNLNSKIKNAFILPNIKGSDHCPIGIELN
ncbi:exodeoxyribonuclease III [Candidatus Beckwithbacteria bacterium]|nr:exodeoxyribonuclease III [Candidatus Beckwithbacteria bacterium]